MLSHYNTHTHTHTQLLAKFGVDLSAFEDYDCEGAVIQSDVLVGFEGHTFAEIAADNYVPTRPKQAVHAFFDVFCKVILCQALIIRLGAKINNGLQKIFFRFCILRHTFDVSDGRGRPRPQLIFRESVLSTPLRPELQEILIATIFKRLKLAINGHFLAIVDQTPATCEKVKLNF